MTAIELVDLIFSMLDRTIQDNLYFQELKKIVFDNCQDDFSSIKVDETIYDQLPFNDFPVEVGSNVFEFE